MFCSAVEPTTLKASTALLLFYSDPLTDDEASLPPVIKASRVVEEKRPFVRSTLILQPHKVCKGFLFYKFGFRFSAEEDDRGTMFLLNFDEFKQINDTLLQYAGVKEFHPALGPVMSNDPNHPVKFKQLDLDLFPSETTAGSKAVTFWIGTLALLYAEVTSVLVRWVRDRDWSSQQDVLETIPNMPNLFWIWFPDCKPRRLSSWLSHLSQATFSTDEIRLLVQVSPMSAGFYQVEITPKDDSTVTMNFLDTANTKLEGHIDYANFFEVGEEDPLLSDIRIRIQFRYDFALSFQDNYIRDFGFHSLVLTRAYLFPMFSSFPFSGIRCDTNKADGFYKRAAERIAETEQQSFIAWLTAINTDCTRTRQQYRTYLQLLLCK